MGKCVVHMQKIKADGLRGVESHLNRLHKAKTNDDIDYSRSSDNIEFANGGNFRKTVQDTIEHFANTQKAIRKDAVVCCSFIITSDEKTIKAMSSAEQYHFFEDSYYFFCNRYGAENVVNATVHYDETTPHMHLGVVPINADGRLSAKSIFTPAELTSLQTDFANEVGKKYGLERGQEGSERSHLSELRFKAETEQKRVNTLVAQKNALEGQIAPLQRVQEVKSFGLGKKAIVNKADLEMLKKTAGTAEGLQAERNKALSVLQNAKQIEGNAEQKAEQIIDEARKKSKSFDFYKKTATLQAEVNKANKSFSRLLKAVEDCGTDIYNKVAERYNKALENENSHNHDMDLER